MVKTDTTLQPPSVWCFMSFVLDGSFLRCRGVPVVLNQLFVAVNFATPWRWKPSCEGASKLSWPENISLLIYQLGFEKSLISQLLPFAFDDQSGGILVLWTKNSGFLAHSLSSSLQCYRIMLLFSWKKKKEKDRGRLFQQWKRQICARSSKNLLACILLHPSRSETVKDILFIRRKESTCAKQESSFNKWRIDVAFSSGCRGTSLLEGIFPLNWPIRARLFLLAPGPNPVVTISTRVGPGRGYRDVKITYFPRSPWRYSVASEGRARGPCARLARGWAVSFSYLIHLLFFTRGFSFLFLPHSSFFFVSGTLTKSCQPTSVACRSASEVALPLESSKPRRSKNKGSVP